MRRAVPSVVRRIDAGAEYLGTVPDGSVWRVKYWSPSGLQLDRVYVALSDVTMRLATELDMRSLRGVRTSFLYRAVPRDSYVYVTVLAGPDEDHRTEIGTIIFRSDEWTDFQAWVEGPGHSVERVSP